MAPVLPVLMYHSVSTVSDGPLRSLAVPAPVLAEQLTALREAGYELLGLTAALARLTADPTAAVVAVTFDDGFLDFATDGASVLTEVGAGATLYLAVGHLGQPAVWLGPRAGDCARLLTWAEVRSLVDAPAPAPSARGPAGPGAAVAGLEIGSHGLVHVPLDVLPASAVVKQVAAARDRLEQHTRSPVPSFAYPHGYHTGRTRRILAEAGYLTACEVGHRLYHLDRDRLAIPRLQVTPDLTGEALVRLVRTGGSPVMPALKDLARPPWRLVRRVAQDGFGVRLT